VDEQDAQHEQRETERAGNGREDNEPGVHDRASLISFASSRARRMLISEMAMA
jgi:hypothetical protein